MHKMSYLLLAIMLGLVSCEWPFLSSEEDENVVIDRYDRIQSLYLTTGDFSALQQMNTVYPMQTRTLIEDVLRIGKVDDQQINTKFLRFYQDTTLQTLIAEAEQQYANMDDINHGLTTAFKYLRDNLIGIEIPEIYTQIGSLDQSIIVGNNSIGICLDKYLGADYPLYQKPEYGYTKEQLKVMERDYIVPDCIGFYLLSLYPIPADASLSQWERDVHVGRIQWVVNKATGKLVFLSKYVQQTNRFMNKNRNLSIDQLLKGTNYSDFR